MQPLLILLPILLIFSFVLSKKSMGSKVDDLPVKPKQENLPPCQACRMFTNSFKKGMDQTSRGKFEGGDALWEESRLKNYANSEIRLVEIQEHMCSNAEKALDQCHQLAETYESLIEDWWFKEKDSFPDLFYFLCIDKLKVCCPDNHYGPECLPCLGGIVNPCNRHGQCKGGGTRKGSGTCRCDVEYTGEFCELCKTGYFNDTTINASMWHCTKCDKSCKGYCREGGPKGCEVCADGFQYSTDLGCIDIDECMEMSDYPCKHGTFCVNSIGSYSCIECDKSCNGCTGDGPDMCDSCAEGYALHGQLCIESKSVERSLHVDIARYATYLGLCVATFIIFRRSMFIAGVIGIFVAVYIGLSEYTIGEWDKRSLIQSVKSLAFL